MHAARRLEIARRTARRASSPWRGLHTPRASTTRSRPSPRCAARFPRLTYRIVGEVRDASYERTCSMLIDRHGLGDCVRITANLSHDDKERALREADLYLQPSHEEGFCLAYIEAAGVVPRLVGTDTGAIRAIGAGDAGARDGARARAARAGRRDARAAGARRCPPT
jgi:hypothetical protein